MQEGIAGQRHHRKRQRARLGDHVHVECRGADVQGEARRVAAGQICAEEIRGTESGGA